LLEKLHKTLKINTPESSIELIITIIIFLKELLILFPLYKGIC